MHLPRLIDGRHPAVFRVAAFAGGRGVPQESYHCDMESNRRCRVTSRPGWRRIPQGVTGVPSSFL
jgi:hypothetical protein